MTRNDITQDLVNQKLTYNSSTGIVFWKDSSHATNIFDGDRAGYEAKNGYRYITLFGLKFSEHRLIWFMLYGEWAQVIDHINHVKNDNILSNLRAVTHSENSKNLSLNKKNNTGIQGIYYNRSKDRYISTIRMNGKRVFEKSYKEENLDKAIQERQAKLKEFGFHDNHGKGENNNEYFK